MMWQQKISLFILLSGILSSTYALADDSYKQINTQFNARDEYARCMTESAFGSGCGNSNCLGFIQSSQNAGKNDKCFLEIKGICLFGKRGHGDKTAGEWNQVTSDQLHAFSACQPLEQVSDITATNMQGGSIEQASLGNGNSIGTDSTSATGSLSIGTGAGTEHHDNSEAFGLKDGEIYNRIRKGETVSSILASSPFGQGLSNEELERLKAMADNPKDALAKLEAEKASSNKEEEGIASANGKSAVDANGEDVLASLENGGGSLTLGLNAHSDNKDKDALANKNGLGSSADGKTGRSPASLAELEKRKYGELYSNDKTIFQMVSSNYRKKMKNFLLFDYYLKQSKAKPPADAKALLEGAPPSLF